MYFPFLSKFAKKAYFKLRDSNIIERRYHMSEEDAANTSSYLLAGSIILYPLVSYESMFVVTSGFTISIVWLHRGPLQASSNRSPASFPILDVNHWSLFVVCTSTDLDKNSITWYFFVRNRPRVLSSSVLDI